MSEVTATTTAVVVLYRTTGLDLDDVPNDIAVILVHNDDTFDETTIGDRRVTHLRSPENLGFGGGVNAALEHVGTGRVVIVNPDVSLTPEHWAALTGGGPDELRTVALDDDEDRPTSVVNAYPDPLGLLLSGYRVGRHLPRGSRIRTAASRWAGGYARMNQESFELRGGSWPLAERWVSGAVMALDTGRLRDVGGFDEGFFLYYEDVDLCQRLAAAHRDMRAVVVGGGPARHTVGASSHGSRRVERHRLASAVRFASRHTGLRWSITETLLRLRQRWV